MVNFQDNPELNEIGYTTSWHTRNKARKSALSPDPKVLPPNTIDHPKTADDSTVRTILKIQLVKH